MFGAAGKTTLVRKILWGVVPVVVVALLSVVLATDFVAERQVDKGIQKEVDSLATQASANIEFIFAQHHNDMRALVESPALVEYSTYAAAAASSRAGGGDGMVQEIENARSALQEQFLSFSARNSAYYRVLFFDTDRKLVLCVEGGKVIEKVDYHSLGFDEVVSKGVFQSAIRAEGGRRRIYYGCVITEKDGADSGVLVLACDLSAVTRMLAATKVGEYDAAYLSDKSETPLIGERSTAREILLRSVAIKGTPWHVVVQADADEFRAPLRTLRNLLLTLLCLTSILVPLLLTVVVRQSTKPIKQLVAGTRRLAAGEMDYRFPQPRIRELSVLADSFNDMAQQVMNREEQLRSRIRQLSALRTMESTVIQRLNEETILRTCLDAVASGLGFDRTGLYWVAQEQQQIVGRFVHEAEPTGLTEETFQQRRIPLISSDVLSQVVQKHEPMLVRNDNAAPVPSPLSGGAGEGGERSEPGEGWGLDDIPGLDSTTSRNAGDPPHPSPLPQGERGLQQAIPHVPAKTQDFVMAPIGGKDRVFGVIAADNFATGKPLEEGDRDGLALFAGAAGLALETAGLFDKLSISEARHRLVLDNSPVAILGLGQDHTINTWNRGAEVMFGYTAEQVMGKPLASLFPNSAEEYAKLSADVLANGAVRDFPIAGVNKAGQPLDLTLSWGGSAPEGGQEMEWAVVIRDVTEAKKLQRHLIFSEKLSAVGQLIAGIAHELNNPLQAVVGYADILNAQEASRGGASREMRHIFENATRCRKIIDNLLLFVRSGKVEKQTVKLQDVIRAGLELLQHKIKKTAKLQVCCDMPTDPVYVKANFQQLEQVLVNIVNNACDAMETWPGDRRMHINVKPSGSAVRVELKDTGPGIPEGVGAKIFEPFFTTKPEGRGTGLGLPVCRQIVAEHGGELQVTTKVGEGTMFFFEIPTVAEPAAEQPAEGAAKAEAPAVSGGSLLLVEDEAAIRELLHQVLCDAGHRVEVAASLQAATAKAAAKWFDVVVSDVQLDDGTGVDLFKQWATNSKQARPPFLFLSGDILTGALGEAVCGDDVYLLQKPVDLKELRSTISTILSKTRQKAA